jgi:hypothetical protein
MIWLAFKFALACYLFGNLFFGRLSSDRPPISTTLPRPLYPRKDTLQ